MPNMRRCGNTTTQGIQTDGDKEATLKKGQAFEMIVRSDIIVMNIINY